MVMHITLSLLSLKQLIIGALARINDYFIKGLFDNVTKSMDLWNVLVVVIMLNINMRKSTLMMCWKGSSRSWMA